MSSGFANEFQLFLADKKVAHQPVAQKKMVLGFPICINHCSTRISHVLLGILSPLLVCPLRRPELISVIDPAKLWLPEAWLFFSQVRLFVDNERPHHASCTFGEMIALPCVLVKRKETLDVISIW